MDNKLTVKNPIVLGFKMWEKVGFVIGGRRKKLFKSPGEMSITKGLEAVIIKKCCETLNSTRVEIKQRKLVLVDLTTISKQMSNQRLAALRKGKVNHSMGMVGGLHQRAGATLEKT